MVCFFKVVLRNLVSNNPILMKKVRNKKPSEYPLMCVDFIIFHNRYSKQT